MAGVASGGFMCRWTTTPGVHSFGALPRATFFVNTRADVRPGTPTTIKISPRRVCVSNTRRRRVPESGARAAFSLRRAVRGACGADLRASERGVRLGARCRSCSRVLRAHGVAAVVPSGGGGDRGSSRVGGARGLTRRGWESVTATAPVSHRAWSAWSFAETRAGPSGPTRGFHARGGADGVARREIDEDGHKDGDKLDEPAPRGIEPPMAPWGGRGSERPQLRQGRRRHVRVHAHRSVAQTQDAAEAPRCRADPGAGEDARDCGFAACHAVPPGDVIRVKVAVLENRGRANAFTGILPRGGTGGMESFTRVGGG